MQHRTNMYFPVALFARIKAFCERTGMPISEMLRRAAVDFLAKHGEK
jgi:hypothetical protein